MSHALYPLGLRVSGRRVVVVGAGPVAARRVRGLLDAGADVLVVAPDAADEVAGHADAGRLRWERRAYRPGDLAGAWLVHVATGDPAVDAAVAAMLGRTGHGKPCIKPNGPVRAPFRRHP